MTEAKTAPSSEELVGRIMIQAFKNTDAQWDKLWDERIAIPRDDRVGALDAAKAAGVSLDAAFFNVGAYANSDLAACLAVLARDSRSESGPFTPAHYEVLTRPWRRVIGAVHPDDDFADTFVAAETAGE